MKKNVILYKMSNILYKATAIIAGASLLIGICSLDSEGTSIPYILCIVGLSLGFIAKMLYQFSIYYYRKIRVGRRKIRPSV